MAHLQGTTCKLETPVSRPHHCQQMFFEENDDGRTPWTRGDQAVICPRMGRLVGPRRRDATCEHVLAQLDRISQRLGSRDSECQEVNLKFYLYRTTTVRRVVD
jgi:hypothetical protein